MATNKKTLLASIASGVLFLGLTAGTASADTIDQILSDNGTFLFSDNSGETLINADPMDTDLTLDLNDRLVGIFEIETIEQTVGGDIDVNIDQGSGNETLSGYFDITVVGATQGLDDTALDYDATCLNYCYVFGATTGFDATLGGLGFSDIDGAAIGLFTDPIHDFDRISTDPLATLIGNVTDGSAYWLFGFGTGDYWTATATTNVVTSLGTIFPGGQFTVALSLLENLSGVQLGSFECFPQEGVEHEVCGNGGLFSAEPGNTFEVLDDVNFVMQVVPEPATIGIFGLGLLGLGLVGRRRRRTV